MKLKLILEPPVNLTAEITSTSPNTVTLTWSLVEDERAYTEIEVYCREQGQSEWITCKIEDKQATSTITTHVDGESQIPFVTGHTYEFSVQSYGAVFPAGPGEDDNRSNIAFAQF